MPRTPFSNGRTWFSIQTPEFRFKVKHGKKFFLFPDECNLHCRQSLENTLYIARGQVDDGTLCEDKSGACINGACILLQDEPESPATTKPPATTTKPPATTTPPQTIQSIPMTTEMDKTPTAAPPTTSSLTPSESSLPPTTQPGPKETTTKATTAPPATTKATTTKTVTQTPSGDKLYSL
jgi:hypothetical protein